MAGVLHMYHSPSPQELESEARIKVLNNSTGIINKFTLYMNLTGIFFNNKETVFLYIYTFKCLCLYFLICFREKASFKILF